MKQEKHHVKLVVQVHIKTKKERHLVKIVQLEDIIIKQVKQNAHVVLEDNIKA